MKRKTTLLDRRAKTPPPKDETIAPRFWETKTLAQMNEAEWEALCDNCGKCCVISIEDIDTGQLHLTDVSCKLFDGVKGHCSDYANRKARVPDCVKLTPKNVPKLDWLPLTCAYRLVSEKQPLHWWHPLVSGDPESVHIAQASARGRTRPEGRLQMSGLIRRITAWPAPLEKPPKGYKRKKRGAS
ncbi:MAG TPA: YcgN family cysteine cluster protein [Terricaulis sp.]|nr:YcgN family cysteine cluster protein [Terricaulis sp.]